MKISAGYNKQLVLNQLANVLKVKCFKMIFVSTKPSARTPLGINATVKEEYMIGLNKSV